MASVMAWDSRSGLMDPSMKASGAVERPMDKVNFITLMEISTKVNGLMTKQMAGEHIHMQTVPNMLEVGKMINNMDTDWRLGPMAPFMRDSTSRARKMAREDSRLLMALYTRGSSK